MDIWSKHIMLPDIWFLDIWPTDIWSKNILFPDIWPMDFRSTTVFQYSCKLGAMTFSITTLSIMDLIVTLSIKDPKHNDTRHSRLVALC